jgi:hypothetical protein
MVGMFRKAVREEAAPVARQLAQVRGLANQTNRRLEQLQVDLDAERHARVDDLAVLVSLISSGWKSIEERLDAIERRLDAEPQLREVA